MVPVAIDAPTIASLATAGGTLVLAVATFASVRSANRSARIAEIALQEQRRPLLAPSRLEDPTQKIMFVEQHWLKADGSRGAAEYVRGNVYLALSLRNVGSGIAVCQGWVASAGRATLRAAPRPSAIDAFRTQTRDLFIAAGDIGMWQGAIRDHDDPDHAALVQAIENREPITIEILYSDQVGGQRTISRFGLSRWPDETWFVAGIRHWFLDGPGPRDEEALLARAEQIMRERASAEPHPDDEFAGRVAAQGDAGYSSSPES